MFLKKGHTFVDGSEVMVRFNAPPDTIYHSLRGQGINLTGQVEQEFVRNIINIQAHFGHNGKQIFCLWILINIAKHNAVRGHIVTVQKILQCNICT